MARRRSSSSSDRRQRDTSDIPTNNLVLRPPPLLAPYRPPVFDPGPPRPNLVIREDRRRYHPEKPYEAAKRMSGIPARVLMQSPRTGVRTRLKAIGRELPAFPTPRTVLVCIRRKMRREVLFALRRTGKGARSRRRNYQSEVRC